MGPGGGLIAVVHVVAKACGNTVQLLGEVGELILPELETQVQGVMVLDAMRVGLACCPGSVLIAVEHLVAPGTRSQRRQHLARAPWWMTAIGSTKKKRI